LGGVRSGGTRRVRCILLRLRSFRYSLRPRYETSPAFQSRSITSKQPKQVSPGVRYVWINGTRVWRDGKHTGAKPGRILRRHGYGAAR